MGTLNSPCLQHLNSHCSCRAGSMGRFISCSFAQPLIRMSKANKGAIPLSAASNAHPKGTSIKSPTTFPCPGQGSCLGLATTAISWLHPPCTAGAAAGCRGEFLIAREQLGQEADRTLPQGGMYGPVRDQSCRFGSFWSYILVELLHPRVRWELICTRAWPAKFGWRSIFLTEIKGTNSLP